ncbi:hypothetical protein [Pleomorphomonas sp. NRK KF1]|uniref:hypothetical protein n=1 Tax=Pleomorphomonas sp. NRK KF1 TaxID=2943000 RepID=UPI002043D2CF|nr:hypothetical protein [Pleomorphomonas sp. NRK KF1]MCM5554519.1 hypothetical protein [Pleomorphomonas sp. NRK KF1]
MPFDETSIVGPVADYGLNQKIGPAPETDPSLAESAAASLRQNNTVISTLTNKTLYDKATGDFYDHIPGYTPFTPENMKGYEDESERFLNIWNPGANAQLKAQIDMERRDKATRAKSGWVGTAFDIGAGIVDLPTLLPGGVGLRGGRAAVGLARAALDAGIAAGGGAVVQEFGLHATQETRTVEDSLSNVGGSALLGGILGGAKYGALSAIDYFKGSAAIDKVKAPDADAATDALHREMAAYANELGGNQPMPQGIGAQGVAPERLADYDIAGKAARATAKATAQLNPLLRTLQSPALTVRQVAAGLMENPVYLTKNLDGAGDAAAESAMRQWSIGAAADAIEANRAAYADARKAGLAMSLDDFNAEAGRAMRRGDASSVAGATEAAEAWRSKVFDPLKQQAIDADLLPADVDVKTAESYFSRMWRRPVLEAREGEFRDIVRRWVSDTMDEIEAKTTKEADATRARLAEERARIETDIARRAKASRRKGRSQPDDDVANLMARVNAGEKLPKGQDLAAVVKTARAVRRVLSDMDRARIAALDAKAADGGRGRSVEFVNAADRADYINGIVDDIFAQLTGRGGASTNFQPVMAARGPLKERTFNIPDHLVEDFLESDIELVGRRYARIMAADIELAKRYGSPTLKDQIAEIRDEYARLREVPGADRKKLGARERADIRDIEAVRDMLRGVYGMQSAGEPWARTLAAARVFNYTRMMGGVVIGSLADAARPAMVHGLRSYVKDGLAPLLHGLQGVRMSAKEARHAGALGETILHSRMAALSEITDPYRHGTVIERLMENLSTRFSRMTGLDLWDDFNRTFASRMTQNRIFDNVMKAAKDGFASLPERERAYMGYLGIGQERAERIGELFIKHGETVDGVHVANTEAWGTEAAGDALRQAFRAAVAKDVGSIIVTKGVGDVPLLATTPIGKSLLQFKSFAIAANQRVLIRGLQEGQTRFIGGVTGMATIGMFIYWLRHVAFGTDVSDNPGTWLAEGLDRSGVFSVLFEANNTFEKMGLPGIYTGAAAAFPGRSQRAPASRFASRGVVDSLLGPTAGTARDIASVPATIANIMKGNPATHSDYVLAKRLAPFIGLWFVRPLFAHVIDPEPQKR